MGQINIHNYEAYLLDFSEGNLTNELQVELELFLIQHPEIDINLSELSLIAIDEEAITYSNKSSLKKTEGDLISETQFIAYIENQLPENEKLELENSCSVNPSLSKELALFKKTIAVADSSIIYENKNELKRKPKVIWFDFSVIRYAAAACVLFLVGLFFLWPSENATHTTIASKQNREAINNKKESILQNTVAITNPNNQTEDVINTPNNIIKQRSKLLANQLTHSKTETPIEKDSSKQSPPIIANQIEEPRIALQTNKEEQSLNSTIVQVITENDEDVAVATSEKKKTGIWAAASRALKNLNHAGVKSVNGNEEDRKSESSYALTLGGVSITHKAGL
jgi:hypothetical protein